MSFSNQYFNEPLQVLLADIAIRIQLSRASYNKAVERYEALGDWIDRHDSSLASQVQLIYPQGSMAIGASIASRLTTDEQDVDFVVQLSLPAETPPSIALDMLYESIRGVPGSRYFNNTERRTRCVTVHYADKMHADITPMVRIFEAPERESILFHSKLENPREPDLALIANPYGFVEWFNANTPLETEFALQFAQRQTEYERSFFMREYDCDEIPNQEPIHRKSKKLIALQLLKRWRNVQYDRRNYRRPPSVLMSKLIADCNSQTESLSDELLFLACYLRDTLSAYHHNGQLVSVTNPVCSRDVLTDRWPESLDDQAVFLDDLNHLTQQIEKLANDCDLAEMQSILANLFGETPTTQVVEDFVRYSGNLVESGQSRYEKGPGKFTIPATVVAPAAIASTKPNRVTPKHTFYGDAF